MQKLSYREYKARLAWLEQEWNNPSRSDYYVMQLAQELIRSQLKKSAKDKLKLEAFKIEFELSGKKKPSTEFKDKAAAGAAARASWVARLGFKMKDLLKRTTGVE